MLVQATSTTSTTGYCFVGTLSESHYLIAKLRLSAIIRRRFWRDALDIATRAKKDESMASEQLAIDLMTKLVSR